MPTAKASTVTSSKTRVSGPGSLSSVTHARSARRLGPHEQTASKSDSLAAEDDFSDLATHNGRHEQTVRSLSAGPVGVLRLRPPHLHRLAALQKLPWSRWTEERLQWPSSCVAFCSSYVACGCWCLGCWRHFCTRDLVVPVLIVFPSFLIVFFEMCRESTFESRRGIPARKVCAQRTLRRDAYSGYYEGMHSSGT